MLQRQIYAQNTKQTPMLDFKASPDHNFQYYEIGFYLSLHKISDHNLQN